MARRRAGRFGKWAFLIVGCTCFAAALVTFVSSWQFVRTARRTTATIIQIEPQITQRPSTPRERPVKIGTYTNYAPVFVFRDEAGATHTLRSSLASSRERWHVGQTVSVLYSPNDPLKAQLDLFAARWGFPITLGIVGIVFTFVGLMIGRRLKEEAAA
jgi:hypothetical protein